MHYQTREQVKALLNHIKAEVLPKVEGPKQDCAGAPECDALAEYESCGKHFCKEHKAIGLQLLNARLRIGVLLGYWHGLRVSEICGQSPDEAQPGKKPFPGICGKHIQDGMVTLQRLKGSLKTEQPFQFDEDPDFDEATPLLKLSDELGLNERVLPLGRFQFAHYFRSACKKAGIPKRLAHPHALKHTCGMNVIAAGVEVGREWLGHRSLASTGAYTRMSQAEVAKRVQEAFKRRQREQEVGA